MRTSGSLDSELIDDLIKARAQFKAIARTKTGQVGQNRTYQYADLETVLDAVMPALSAHGLALLQTVDAETNTLLTRLVHTSGQWIESAHPLGDYGQPQVYGSQLTYARRYSILALLCLAQEDDDAQSASDNRAAAPPRVASPAAPPVHQAPAIPGAEPTYTVTKLVKKPGQSDKGPYTRYAVTFDDQKTASTFSDTLGKLAETLAATREPCLRTIEQKGNYLNLIELVRASDVAYERAAGPDTEPF